MISRRNIRIKVMQALYASDQHFSPQANATATPQEGIILTKASATHMQEAEKLLAGKINQSAALFYLLLTYLCKVAQYAATDAQQRAAKHLATEEDKHVSTKLAGNIALSGLWEDASFQANRKALKVDHYVKSEWVKKLYKKLIQTEDYRTYTQEAEHRPAADKEMLYFIWHDVMQQHESFLSDLSDDWINWEDDSLLMDMLIDNYFHKPSSTRFKDFISKEKKAYAEDLLQTVIEKQGHLLQIIRPKLKNWKADRIAQIDMVLLKMGLAEFLYFPTIPEKATINEYIEIAKQYSTDQSGQFVNGVLDSLRKELLKENKLRKIAHSK